MTDIITKLAEELSIQPWQATAAVELLDGGNTVPFIARYRKEVTGSLDDAVLRTLLDRLTYLRNLETRKEEVRALIDGQGKLTPEIVAALDAATMLNEIEDIYRPYRPKRKTRASVARERGLAPLAEMIMAQKKHDDMPLTKQAEQFISEDAGVATAEDALAGACDILAEDISDCADYRRRIKAMIFASGRLASRGIKEEDSVYTQYYDFAEPLRTLPGYRILAINRGEKEAFLRVSVEADNETILAFLYAAVMTDPDSEAAPYVRAAIEDSYTRLIFPSVEREIRHILTERAEEGAIQLFGENLGQLLMQPPLRKKTVLGYDPGYRTGCKLAVVDPTGKVLDTAVIYPTKPREQIAESTRTVIRLIERYHVDVIAIGNGTASKESEIFIAGVLRELDADVKYIMVSEAGASVYSASKLAAEEFPDFDVTQRSAVSIARRLQDPLAELVKIEPKAIGVGQYQHDMKQARLDETLSGVVESCVNRVGVDLNTASYALLSYIAGINAATAKNIVQYRDQNGSFRSRAEILRVPRLGGKAYEQCAGFLRVSGSAEILDNTGVHPESYDAAHRLLDLLGFTEEDVVGDRASALRAEAERYGMERLCEELRIGAPTLLDIIAEMEKPGRDVRDDLPQPILRDDILAMEDLREGMMLTGTVRNVIDFGAFVDIGVHQDGLVHISELSDRFVRHPSEVVHVGDIVQVRIKHVDLQKKRIALSMKGNNK